MLTLSVIAILVAAFCYLKGLWDIVFDDDMDLDEFEKRGKRGAVVIFVCVLVVMVAIASGAWEKDPNEASELSLWGDCSWSEGCR